MNDLKCCVYSIITLTKHYKCLPQVPAERQQRMPTAGETLGSSISTFLNKTDAVSQQYRAAQMDSQAAAGTAAEQVRIVDERRFRFKTFMTTFEYHTKMDYIQRLAGRASSVARATSVSRQFEPTSGSSFMRAGSVARGYEVSAITVPRIQYYLTFG